MNIQEIDLTSLRQTILEHRWKESYEMMSVVFAKDLPQFTILVAEQIVQCQFRFRSRYDLEWIMIFAQEIINLMHNKHMSSKALELLEQSANTFADAPYGVTDLVGAVVELNRSVSTALTDDQRAGCLALAQDKLIVAEIGDYWEAVHPGVLQLKEVLWKAETTSDGRKVLPDDIDTEKLYRGISFLKQAESLGYRSARLLNIVDEIEQMFHKGGTI